MSLNTPPKFTTPPWTLIAAGTTLTDRAFFLTELRGDRIHIGAALLVFLAEETANSHARPSYHSVQFESLGQFADALRHLDATGTAYHLQINTSPTPNHEPKFLVCSVPALLESLGI